jgi:myo-inositol catabolism protein IolS
MEEARVGHSDLYVSRLGLGGWQASGWSTSDDATYERIVHAAIDRGITLFDTAPSYGKGHGEYLLGRSLVSKRSQCIIATKFGPKDSTPERIKCSLEASLRNLKTDYIDIYQQHWPPSSPPVQETIEALVRLREEGKIRAIGVSNWGPREFSEVLDCSPIVSVQGAYSLLWRKAEREIFPWCEEKKVGFFAYSPLCQGVLAGKFEHNSDLPKDSRRQNIFLQDALFPEVKTFLNGLSDSFVGEESRSLAHVALRWVLHQKPVTSTLIGCSSLSHLEAACRALEMPLSPELQQRLSELSEKFVSATKPYMSLWGWHPRARRLSVV